VTLPAPLKPLYRYMGSKDGLHLDAEIVKYTGRSLFGYLFTLDSSADLEMFSPEMRERRRKSHRLALATIGHKTGRIHTIAIAYQPGDNGECILIGSAGGSPTEPHWVRNLRANPLGWVWIDRKCTPVRATILEGEAKREIWEQTTARAPIFATYQTNTERDIPVVVLRPYTGETS
jgi:deazaflavin-dependent oxidoreductase (nitroreductase family)